MMSTTLTVTELLGTTTMPAAECYFFRLPSELKLEVISYVS